MLTLSTCTPGGASRFIVMAKLVEVNLSLVHISADYGTHAEAFSRQSSGDSDSFIQDSRSVPQQNGPDFSGIFYVFISH